MHWRSNPQWSSGIGSRRCTAHRGNAGEEDGTAVALAACATEAQLDDLISFLAMDERGQSRIYFIRPILNVGGNRGREVVEALRADPVFGKKQRRCCGAEPGRAIDLAGRIHRVSSPSTKYACEWVSPHTF